jgi:hypothetical protein
MWLNGDLCRHLFVYYSWSQNRKIVEIVQFEVNFLKDGARKYWTRERERSYHWKSLTISTTARADFSFLFFDMVTCFRGYHSVVLRYYTDILSGMSAWLFFEGYVQDLSIMADWSKQLLQEVMRAVQCHRTVKRQRGSTSLGLCNQNDRGSNMLCFVLPISRLWFSLRLGSSAFPQCASFVSSISPIDGRWLHAR